MKKPWDMLRPSLGLTREAVGYTDLLRDYFILLCMYVQQICLAFALYVSPDLREARLVWGSVRASLVSKPCTTSSYYTGPYIVMRYIYT